MRLRSNFREASERAHLGLYLKTKVVLIKATAFEMWYHISKNCTFIKYKAAFLTLIFKYSSKSGLSDAALKSDGLSIIISIKSGLFIQWPLLRLS